MKSKRVKEPGTSSLKDVEVVYCDVVSTPCFYVGYYESRRQPTDWMFEFRANVQDDHLRGIRAFTYFATWRIASKLPGRLAAIVELKERALRKGIALLEVFGVWEPQDTRDFGQDNRIKNR